MSPNAHMRRTFRERTFSKMEAGSIRGSIFALCSSAIGAGVLSLPYVLALNGWAVGVAYILVGAVAATWSNNILAYRACEHDQRNYSQLCALAGGPKLAMFLRVCILIYIFGVLIGYQIIVTQLFTYALEQFGVVDNDFGDSKKMASYQAIPTAVAILYPLCIKRDMSAFRYVSIFSLVALGYTAIVLMIELPGYYDQFKPISTVSAYYLDWNLFTGLAMTFFSYQC
jgi:amino acid permease